MMKRLDSRVILGSLLLIGGGLALMQAMGYLENASDLFWGGIFIALGLLFLSLLFGGHWWSLFPGFALLAIGAVIFLPDSAEDLGGLIFLGGISLAFWAAYATSPGDRWWALMPAGALTTLAIISVVGDRLSDQETAAIFFGGFAITFLLVRLLAGMRWAHWPALGLGIMAVLAFLSLLDISNYVAAAALMCAGLYLLFRYFTNR
jgi:hypothetical protein